MRTRLIAGNWKMNHTPMETREFLRKFHPVKREAELLICPPSIDLLLVQDALQNTFVQWGAQNVHFETSGAFTGEVSPAMLQSVGCTYCICGHSERRQLFHETDEDVARKTKALLVLGISPIVCVGETKEERIAGQVKKRISEQLHGSLAGLEEDDMVRLVIAYEPIWAIGSGEAASPEDAQEMASYIRSILKEMVGGAAADSIRILYGGSVKKENSSSFLQGDIDGALIGGASLEADELMAIYEQV